jgi:hypothetical protein
MALSNQQVFDYYVNNPGMTDADALEFMRKNAVSPEQVASTFNLPLGEVISRLAPFLPRDQGVLLGDTWISGNYRYDGSGEGGQPGPLESIFLSKTTGGVNDKQPVGTPIQIYSPTGEFVNTTTTKKDLSFFGGIKEALKDPYVQAAILGVTAGATGLFSGAGTAATVGTTGLTAAELAAYDIALGGAGGTTGATTLAGALTTGATVPTLTNLTGGSGLLTGEAAGITAQSVADKLAADAAAQAQARIAADAIAADAAAQASTREPPDPFQTIPPRPPHSCQRLSRFH